MNRARVIWNDAHEVVNGGAGYLCVACGYSTNSLAEMFDNGPRCQPHLVSITSAWTEMNNPPPISDEWL